MAVDALCLVVFAAIGRHSHHEHDDVLGVLKTASPFAIGAAVGWALARGWRAPRSVVPTGLGVWLGTICVGMPLRRLVGQGVAPSFIVVASIVTALFLLGWRLIAALVAERSNR